VTRLVWILTGALVATIVVATTSAAAPDRRPPRIVAAAMLDADGDALADRVRLTYSERIRHVSDADGRYPFAVPGYRIRSVGRATGKALLILLVEPGQADTTAAPAIRYVRTRSQPVRDRAGNQAPNQRFARTRAHGHVAPAQPRPGVPTPADTDRDGTPDAEDCAPRNAAIHPGAADVPDLDFVDSDCDAIDGTEEDAVFVSPTGNDANPGTKAKPKRQIQSALDAARATGGRVVLVAFGTYGQVTLATGDSIYGGYDPTNWARRDRFPDGLATIEGSGHGVLAEGAKNVVVQHMKVTANAAAGAAGESAYGIRAISGASLALQRAVVIAGNGTPGRPGIAGARGAAGGDGGDGKAGSCDGEFGVGGGGGSSVADRQGGRGGDGGWETERFGGLAEDGDPGRKGKPSTAGGRGGAKGNPGAPGQSGRNGDAGRPGLGGTGGGSSIASAGQLWDGRDGAGGLKGKPGDGGGGGGGGGSQQGVLANNGGGNGGGGGGGGGDGGGGGAGGRAGGGSFGIYLFDSQIVVGASRIVAGDGGAGGRGGDGGREGAGGIRGRGGRACLSEVGAGGNGGAGGAGGRGGGGGGGAGGPSVAVLKAGSSTATLADGSTATAGRPGPGGAGGSSAPGGEGDQGETGIAKPIVP
jgi:hypothetical protein